MENERFLIKKNGKGPKIGYSTLGQEDEKK